MLHDYFYNESIKKIVAVFGTLFNNIKVMNVNTNDASIVRVPLAYGPKQKFLARIDENQNLQEESKVAIRLPRMSFEITSLTYDDLSKASRMNKIYQARDETSSKYKLGSFVPYRMTLQLNVMTKTQNEGLQIIEQIFPYFQPEYTVTINNFSDFEQKADVPFVLTGVNLQDSYESDFVSRRAIIYSLDFETRLRFYGPTIEASVIKEVIVTTFNDRNLTEKLEVQTTTATGTPDSYTVTETIELGFE